MNRSFLSLLIAALGCLPAGPLMAQTFTAVYTFTAPSNSPPYGNIDGLEPQAGLILSGSTLFGTASGGGAADNGTVFKLKTDGTRFTNLHGFTATTGPNNTNSDGAGPHAGLILSGTTLYGTTHKGGSSANGTVFAVNVDGTGFTNLHNFTATPDPGPYINSDGAFPSGSLVLAANTLYGTTSVGGSSGNGTVFAVNTDGTGFTNLHSFDGATGAGGNGLILSSNTLYGTTASGGSWGSGTVFRINTDGTGFTNLYSFTAFQSSGLPYNTNSDGASPESGLALSGSTLYGTTLAGGGSGYGTVFALHTDGTDFTNLHSLAYSDGNAPNGLTLSGNTLYGTASGGGSSGGGTVFAVSTNGSGFTNLHNFTYGADGAGPIGLLILSGNKLYGTASVGGKNGVGTVFTISLSLPQLSIFRSDANVVLTWPTSYTGFTLQSATNLGPSAIWTTVSPAPVALNGQYTVTNPISGMRKFYRLAQ